jgi:dihydrofolate reductase
MQMPKLRVHNLSISLDGYAAGPDQSPDAPLGVNGEKLHEWVFATRYGRQMLGEDGGDEGIDNRFLMQGDEGIGATIMGRNMFGPIRGDWEDDQWKGWWGDNPPYHHPVFVLTHHPRQSVEMQGGTIFHFVDDGIKVILARAFEAASGKDVRLGGGAATIQQYLGARLIDEMHFVIVPVLLGGGERLFDNLAGLDESYECIEFVGSHSVAHVRISKRRSRSP